MTLAIGRDGPERRIEAKLRRARRVLGGIAANLKQPRLDRPTKKGAATRVGLSAGEKQREVSACLDPAM
jgi:hypothetical protein